MQIDQKKKKVKGIFFTEKYFVVAELFEILVFINVAVDCGFAW